MKNVIECKYRGWWDLLDELPVGWRIDKASGSPLAGYVFAISGSILKGGKRALLKLDEAINKFRK